MITRITGRLVQLDKDRAQLDLENGLVYEVLLPSFAVARLGGSLDQRVTLHTLHYFEGTAQGANMFPRLAGFPSRQDRGFFELLVSVKGIGHRKALRAMALATPQLAAAVAERDLATLQSLPEIGKRTAETIAVTLRDKVEHFLTAPAAASARSAGDAADAQTAAPGPAVNRKLARDALDALTALGENRVQAAEWIEQILTRDDPPDDVAAVIREVYVLKAGT